MTTLEQGIQEIAAAVGRGEGGIVLADGETLGEANPDWSSTSALASIRTIPPPFATIAVGGAGRAVAVDGGAIMAVGLDKLQVTRLRDSCTRILKEAEKTIAYDGHLLIKLAEAGLRWQRSVESGDPGTEELSLLSRCIADLRDRR